MTLGDDELDNALCVIECKIEKLADTPPCGTSGTIWNGLCDFRRQLAEIDSDLKALCKRI